MKKVFFVLLIAMAFGCSKDDEPIKECDCTRFNWKIEWVVNNTGTGMIQQHNLIDSYDVGCKDEVTKADFDGVTYYNIKCGL